MKAPTSPECDDISKSLTTTEPQNSLHQETESENKENLIDSIVSPAPIAKKGRGRAKKNATRVEVLAAEEEVTTGRITRSSVRGGGIPSSPPATRRTTRSRAGKAGRNSKRQVSHAPEVVNVESNNTDTDEDGKIDKGHGLAENEKEADVNQESVGNSSTAGTKTTTPPRVRRSTRNAARAVKSYYEASPPHLSSPLLRSQRKNTRNVASPPPKSTDDHQPLPSHTTHPPHSTTDVSQPHTSTEGVGQSLITPPSQFSACAATVTKKTKTGTPHPASLTASPSHSPSTLNNTPSESHSAVNRVRECLVSSVDLMTSQKALHLMSSPTELADKTICNSPLTEWCTASSTVVKQPPSQSASASLENHPAVDTGVDNVAAPHEIGNIPHLSYNDVCTSPVVPAEPDTTHPSTLCATVTKKQSHPSTSELRDSGISSGRSNEGGDYRERGSGGTLMMSGGGKRLRSVSLEKISLTEIEAKRMSLSTAPTNAGDPPEEGEEGGEMVDSPDEGEEPFTCFVDMA